MNRCLRSTKEQTITLNGNVTLVAKTNGTKNEHTEPSHVQYLKIVIKSIHRTPSYIQSWYYKKYTQNTMLYPKLSKKHTQNTMLYLMLV